MINAGGDRRRGKGLPFRKHSFGFIDREPGGDPEACPQCEGCCSRPPPLKPVVGVVTCCDQNSRRIQERLSSPRCEWISTEPPYAPWACRSIWPPVCSVRRDGQDWPKLGLGQNPHPRRSGASAASLRQARPEALRRALARG